MSITWRLVCSVPRHMYVTHSGFHVPRGVGDLCNFLTKPLDCSVVAIYRPLPLFSLRHSGVPVCPHKVLALCVYTELYCVTFCLLPFSLYISTLCVYTELYCVTFCLLPFSLYISTHCSINYSAT